MQIVINISEEDYEGLKRKDKLNDMYLNYYEKLIVHGTPLPKGHGRLIDADAMNIHDVSPVYEMEVYGVTQDDIEYEPTIIESDKESELNERK